MKTMKSLLFVSSLLFLFSCQKETIINENHVNIEIDGNTPPPFSGVTTIQIENYVNKMFIDLLGREPLQNELTDVTNILKTNNFSDESRDNILKNLMNNAAYYNRFHEIYNAAFLNGVTSQFITQYIFIFDQQRQDAQNQGNTLLANFYQSEVNRLSALLTVASEYQMGNLTINEYFSILIDNFFYDEINMGSENFVIACFENLFKRLPNDAELDAGVQMVDGTSSRLLLVDGSSKGDFINIVTTTPSFEEGLILEIYRQLLARDPSSVETANGIIAFSNGVTYQELQRTVIKTSEYAGF